MIRVRIYLYYNHFFFFMGHFYHFPLLIEFIGESDPVFLNIPLFIKSEIPSYYFIIYSA